MNTIHNIIKSFTDNDEMGEDDVVINNTRGDENPISGKKWKWQIIKIMQNWLFTIKCNLGYNF